MQDAVSGFATLVWPPSGIALASLILGGMRLWPAVALAAFTANLSVGAPILSAVAISIGNTLEAVFAAYFLCRVVNFSRALDRQKEIVFLLIACCVGGWISATFGAGSLGLVGVRTFEGFWLTWRAWWIGDVLGMLIVTPMILIWSSNTREDMRSWRSAEVVALAFALGFMGQIVFGPLGEEEIFSTFTLPYTLFPPVIWAALRFGQLGNVTVIFTLTLMGVVGTDLGYGPFVHGTLRESLLHLHTFTAIMTLTGLFLAASVLERRRAIRDREKIEDKLKQSYANLEQMVEIRTAELDDLYNNAPCGYHSIEKDGTYVRINDTELAWLGYTREEMIGKIKFTDVTTDKGRETFARFFPVFLKQGWISGVEFEMVRKDGTTFPAILNSTVIYDENGEFLRTRATVFDITERKLNEEKLEERVKRRTEELSQAIAREKTARSEVEFMAKASQILNESLDYHKTLQSLADLVVSEFADWCSIDLALREEMPRKVAIAHPDPEKRKLALEIQQTFPTDWSARRGPPEVIRSGRSEIYSEISEQLLRTLAHSNTHLEVIIKLGLKSVMVVPLLSRGKTIGAITLIQAESGRRYTEHDLQLAEELGRRAGQAVDNAFLYAQAQKAVRIRDEFLSIASHELKTPLTSLRLQTELRMRNIDRKNFKFLEPESLRKSMAIDIRQVDRLNHLIDDMLDVSRLHAGKFPLRKEEVDLCLLTREVVDRHALQLEARGCTLAIDTCESCTGLWDRARLEQVITNLLTNAMKYGSGKPIEIRVGRSDGVARMSIRNQGIGIAKENQKRIFQQFERAVSPSEASGMGLGLFIAKEIVQALGGEILLQSELGKGATFSVVLPCNDAQTERRASYIEPTSFKSLTDR